MPSRKSKPRPSVGRARRRSFPAMLERMEPRRLLANFTVTTTADGGPGSLRAAILASDLPHLGADTIDFAIPASTAPGLDVPVPGFDPTTQTWRITLAGPLPAITHQVTIDGFSQAKFGVPFRYPNPPTNLPNQIVSNPNITAAIDGNTAIPRLIVDGSGAGGATGFVLDSSAISLRGLIIDGFGVGVSVPNPGDVGDLIQGDDIGRYPVFPVDPTTGVPITLGGVNVEGLAGRGNSLQGVLLGSTNATVGGLEPQDSDVIIGNGQQGVSILAGSQGNQVLGDQVGTLGPASTGGIYFDVPNGSDGVRIADSSNLVGGASAGAGNLISGNLGDGVHIVGPAATRNDVQGNYIGVGAGGGFSFGSANPGNLGDGVTIEDAGDNLVGGPSTADRNVISANSGAGVRIFGGSGVRNRVQGNTIGLTADGISALGNGQEGVAIGSADNVVGPSNVISANLRGVLLIGPGATGNLVRDNLIGTDSTGTADLGNAQEGVRVDGGSGNVISGNARGSQVISGNDVGVLLIGVPTTGNQVAGNLIGTDLTGTRDLGNSQAGVQVLDAPGNSIGGPSATARNLISANHYGVVIAGPGSLLDAVQGNFIGTDITGLAALGNELDGVDINTGASGNLVGGTPPSAGNTVAFNRRDGVRVEDASVGNAILGNSIFANLGLGINLAGTLGQVPGPNRRQAAPALTAVATSIGSTIISGTLASTPNTTFTIEFFFNSPLDPTGMGEGGQFVGRATATSGADGVATFSANVPSVLKAGQVVTATATDPAGDSSEFSNPLTEVFGTVQFQMAGYTVAEGVGTATIVATRSGGSGGAFTVDYATADGTAHAGSAYLPASGTLRFGAGQNVQTFAVTVVDNGQPEGDVTVLLALGNPTGPVTLGPQGSAVLTILGNQPGAFQFQMAGYSVNEAAGTATITVARNQAGLASTVRYATADGSAVAGTDYLPTSGTLTFNPGEFVKSFTVPILINPLIRADETILLTLSSPTGGATLGSPASAVLVIVYDGVNRMGPHVTSVRAVSGPYGIAEIVVGFDEPLDPTRAVDLLNYGYSVRTAGLDGKLGTGDDGLVGLCPATYDPVALTVTLPLAVAVPARTKLLLMIDAVTDVPGANVGVSDLLGNLLDGNGDGHPGGPFSATVVAQPAPTLPHPAVAKSAGHAAKPARHPVAVGPAKGHPHGHPTARPKPSAPRR